MGLPGVAPSGPPGVRAGVHGCACAGGCCACMRVGLSPVCRPSGQLLGAGAGAGPGPGLGLGPGAGARVRRREPAVPCAVRSLGLG